MPLHWSNARNGIPRNIFIDGGRILMRTRYHKKQQQFDRLTPINRLLPPDVGEAVVYYICLVLLLL